MDTIQISVTLFIPVILIANISRELGEALTDRCS